VFGLERCQCLKTCNNGTERPDGELWQMDQCTVCKCQVRNIVSLMRMRDVTTLIVIMLFVLNAIFG